MRKIPLLAVIVLICQGTFPQARAAETPETRAQTFFAAHSPLNLEALFESLHPKAILEFKAKILKKLEERVKEVPGTKLAVDFSRFESLKAVPEREFFISIMTVISEHVIGKLEDGQQSQPRFMREVIGHVTHGESKSYVVYRSSAKPAHGTGDVHTLELELDGKSWKVAFAELEPYVGRNEYLSIPKSPPTKKIDDDDYEIIDPRGIIPKKK